MPEDTNTKNYVQGQHRSAIARHAARTADNSAAFLLPYLAKLPPNFKFLDLGCGPGSITLDIASRFPQAKFLGVDTGEVQVAHARELAAQKGASNVTFIQGNILELDGEAAVEWGAYDMVYTHQVLVHMQRPIEGLKVMRRAARADGGIVASRESFYAGQLIWPRPPPMDRYYKTLFGVMQQNGSDIDTGEKLVDFALQAGWKRDQITATCGANTLDTDEERKAFGEGVIDGLTDPESSSRQRFLGSGLVDESGVAEFIEAWRQWLAEPGAWGAMVNGEIICRNKH